MVFRLLTIGLCTACVVLLATLEPVQVRVVRPAGVHAQIAAPPPPLSVVDVAADVVPSSIPRLVRLARDEWISAINDQLPNDDGEAEQLIGALARHGSFLDLTVARGATERRVLLLIH